MIVKYSDKYSQFLETNANLIVTHDGQEWFFFPYCMRKIKDGIYEEMEFTKLPKDVQDEIKKREAEPPRASVSWTINKPK